MSVCARCSGCCCKCTPSLTGVLDAAPERVIDRVVEHGGRHRHDERRPQAPVEPPQPLGPGDGHERVHRALVAGPLAGRPVHASAMHRLHAPLLGARRGGSTGHRWPCRAPWRRQGGLCLHVISTASQARPRKHPPHANDMLTCSLVLTTSSGFVTREVSSAPADAAAMRWRNGTGGAADAFLRRGKRPSCRGAVVGPPPSCSSTAAIGLGVSESCCQGPVGASSPETSPAQPA